MAGDALLRRAQDERGGVLRQAQDERDQVDLDCALVLRQARGDRRPPVIFDPTGSGRAEEIDLDFTIDEQDRVWMIRDGDCHILGRAEPVCAKLRCFLADVALGGDGYVG